MRSCCRIRRWSRATCIALAGGHDVARLSDVRAWNRRATPTPTPKPTELLTLVRPPLLPPLLRLQHQHRHRHQHQHHHQDQHQHHFGADLIRERGYPKPSPLPNLGRMPPSHGLLLAPSSCTSAATPTSSARACARSSGRAIGGATASARTNSSASASASTSTSAPHGLGDKHGEMLALEGQMRQQQDGHNDDARGRRRTRVHAVQQLRVEKKREHPWEEVETEQRFKLQEVRARRARDRRPMLKDF